MNKKSGPNKSHSIASLGETIIEEAGLSPR